MAEFNLQGYAALSGIGSAFAMAGKKKAERRDKAFDLYLQLAQDPRYELIDPDWEYKRGNTAVMVRKAFKISDKAYAGQRVLPEGAVMSLKLKKIIPQDMPADQVTYDYLASLQKSAQLDFKDTKLIADTLMATNKLDLNKKKLNASFMKWFVDTAMKNPQGMKKYESDITALMDYLTDDTVTEIRVGDVPTGLAEILPDIIKQGISLIPGGVDFLKRPGIVAPQQQPGGQQLPPPPQQGAGAQQKPSQQEIIMNAQSADEAYNALMQAYPELQQKPKNAMIDKIKQINPRLSQQGTALPTPSREKFASAVTPVGGKQATRRTSFLGIPELDKLKGLQYIAKANLG